MWMVVPTQFKIENIQSMSRATTSSDDFFRTPLILDYDILSTRSHNRLIIHFNTNQCASRLNPVVCHYNCISWQRQKIPSLENYKFSRWFRVSFPCFSFCFDNLFLELFTSPKKKFKIPAIHFRFPESPWAIPGAEAFLLREDNSPGPSGRPIARHPPIGGSPPWRPR